MIVLLGVYIGASFSSEEARWSRELRSLHWSLGSIVTVTYSWLSRSYNAFSCKSRCWTFRSGLASDADGMQSVGKGKSEPSQASRWYPRNVLSLMYEVMDFNTVRKIKENMLSVSLSRCWINPETEKGSFFSCVDKAEKMLLWRSWLSMENMILIIFSGVHFLFLIKTSGLLVNFPTLFETWLIALESVFLTWVLYFMNSTSLELTIRFLYSNSGGSCF